jgi:glycosyltransferase involved in cell wall biosynthesis
MAKKVKSKKWPAIVGMTQESPWGSCKVITPNLLKAYQLLYQQKYNYFGYNDGMTNAEIIELARQILQTFPSRIIILDHMPHPGPLFLALETLVGAERLPPVDIHLYGDFTLYTRNWTAITPVLEKMDLRFYCASPRQMKLVQNMMKGFENIFVCPFPVDPDIYYVSPKRRAKIREKHGIQDSDFLVCYTGRLSYQKNSLKLAKEILALMREHSGRKIKFILAGTFDSLGAPFFGFNTRPGEYFSLWQSWHESLSPDERSRIDYIGQVGAEDLCDLYNGSDLFVSLSTHHDEDYGMSPVEALFCGCPSVLSSWGGYQGFALDSRSCLTVPLKLRGGAYQFSSAEFKANCWSLLNQKGLYRRSRSELYIQSFSIEAASQIIEKSQKCKKRLFPGWTKVMFEHGRRVAEMWTGGQVFEPRPHEKSFYYRIYRWYSKG